MTGFAKTLIAAAVPLTLYAVATFIGGIEPDWGLALLAACICLATAVLWEYHVHERRQQMADYALWMAGYRHEQWARRDSEAGSVSADVAARRYGFYTTAPSRSPQPTDDALAYLRLAGEAAERRPMVATNTESRKRGRPPTHGITVGMYFDYCTGLSVEQVAEKWGYRSVNNVYDRFRAMGLPLRTRSSRVCACAGRPVNNPHDIAGANFAGANRERTRVAARLMVERAKYALPSANPYARGILQLRIDHPDATLAELAALHEPPVTKNAVASVLRRARAGAA